MTVPKYLIVDYIVLENRLKEMINNLTNLKKNENGELYFYGSRTEQLECEHNKEIILSYNEWNPLGVDVNDEQEE